MKLKQITDQQKSYGKFYRTKEQIADRSPVNVVYQIDWKSCGQHCIRQTGKKLVIRIRAQIGDKKTRSIAANLANEDHELDKIKYRNVKVLTQQRTKHLSFLKLCNHQIHRQTDTPPWTTFTCWRDWGTNRHICLQPSFEGISRTPTRQFNWIHTVVPFHLRKVPKLVVKIISFLLNAYFGVTEITLP